MLWRSLDCRKCLIKRIEEIEERKKREEELEEGKILDEEEIC